MGYGEIYCRSCGELIKEKAEICPYCGVRNYSGSQDNYNPTLLKSLSFIFAIIALFSFLPIFGGLGIYLATSTVTH